jgi:adenylate kinase
MRKYVIMGIQGSGKGTHSDLLATDFDLVHIGVGDIFRWNVANHTKLGAHVRRVMAIGELVGDDVVQSVIQRRLAEHDWNYGFIIDGFPRNVAQAEFFMDNYDVDAVIHLDMPDTEVVARVVSRSGGHLRCEDCGLDYDAMRDSPARLGKCDSCGGDLTIVTFREDDKAEALAVRLREYHEQTEPAIDMFRRKEKVVTVDARPAKELVQQQIRKLLGLPFMMPAGAGEPARPVRPPLPREPVRTGDRDGR